MTGKRPSGSTWVRPRGAGSYRSSTDLTTTGRPSADRSITDTTVWATFRVTEPLILSPFVFGHSEGKQGFHGIQTINFQVLSRLPANRCWRSVGFYEGITTPTRRFATVTNFANSQLIFQFITPMPATCSSPAMSCPTTSGPSIDNQMITWGS
jgi:hypothetical protein